MLSGYKTGWESTARAEALAYVGAVGTDSVATDITVLGDILNTTARVCSAAIAGKILASRAACTAVGLDLEKAEIRHLELKGKSLPSVYFL